MSLILTKRPLKNVTLINLAGPTPTPVDFKWNAVMHPIEYEFQRRDFEIVSVADGVFGLINVMINADLTATPPTVGDLFYVNSGPYKGAYPLVSYTVMAPNTLLKLLNPFLGNTFSGYVNWFAEKPNYYIEVTVRVNDNLTGAQTDVGTMRITPDIDGNAVADVSAWLKKRMAIKNRSPYTPTTLLQYEYESFQKFWILFREMWTGANFTPTEDSISEVPQKLFATNSVRQIGDKYGSNLKDFIPVNFDADVKAKFICDFAEPTYFGPAYPFDIGVIVSEYIYSYSLIRRERPYDQNGTNTGVNDTAISFGSVDTIGIPGEYRMMLTGNYGTGVSKIKASIVLNGIIQQRYVNQQYVVDTYTEIVPPSVSFGAPFECTEQRTIRVKENCYDAPVWIAWKGSEGAWSYYLFYYRQFESPEDKAIGTYQPNIGDLETTESITEVLQKSRQNKVIIGANQLDENDIRGVWKMLDSPKVQMMVSLSPLKWQTVIISPGKKLPFDTRLKRGDIEFTLELAERLTLSQ